MSIQEESKKNAKQFQVLLYVRVKSDADVWSAEMNDIQVRPFYRVVALSFAFQS